MHLHNQVVEGLALPIQSSQDGQHTLLVHCKLPKAVAGSNAVSQLGVDAWNNNLTFFNACWLQTKLHPNFYHMEMHVWNVMPPNTPHGWLSGSSFFWSVTHMHKSFPVNFWFKKMFTIWWTNDIYTARYLLWCWNVKLYKQRGKNSPESDVFLCVSLFLSHNSWGFSINSATLYMLSQKFVTSVIYWGQH